MQIQARLHAFLLEAPPFAFLRFKLKAMRSHCYKFGFKTQLAAKTAKLHPYTTIFFYDTSPRLMMAGGSSQ